MGFLQARLQGEHGPSKAVILTEIPFALWHLPFVLVETGGELLPTLLLLGIWATAQSFGRVIIMWLYNDTHGSVFLAGMFHAAHNTTINQFTFEFLPGSIETKFLIVEGVVILAAVLLLIFTRGRLSYQADQVSQIVASPATKE